MVLFPLLVIEISLLNAFLCLRNSSGCRGPLNTVLEVKLDLFELELQSGENASS